jgi:hypothetical protein
VQGAFGAQYVVTLAVDVIKDLDSKVRTPLSYKKR